ASRPASTARCASPCVVPLHVLSLYRCREGTGTSGGTVATRATLGSGQFVHLDELGPFDPLEHQLRDPFAPLQVQRVARVVVDDDHLDLAAVTGIDGARRVHEPEAGARGEAGARMHERSD